MSGTRRRRRSTGATTIGRVLSGRRAQVANTGPYAGLRRLTQSFNALNQMRILGRWMRMITIPNQSSVAKAYQEFDANGRIETVVLL